MLKDASVVNFNHLKGHCVLTSDGIQNLLKRMRTPRPNIEMKDTDEDLLESYLELLTNYERFIPNTVHNLKVNINKGIKDNNLTKAFKDWDDTISQLDGFVLPNHSYNFSHLQSYRCARKILKHMFSTVHFDPIPVYYGMDTSIVWSNPGASAGAVNYGTKRENEKLCFSYFNKLKNGIKDHVKFDDLQIPAIPTHRSQISGFYNSVDYDDHQYYGESLKRKNRIVWIIDGATTLLESQYAVPVQNYLSNTKSWYAGGKSPEVMREFMASFTRSGYNWISIDYSKYDQTVPAQVIHHVFVDCIRPCFGDEYQDELKFIEYNFIHTKMLLPGNILFVKHRGIPSGSMFTQIIGTLCNLLIGLTYLCSKYGANEESQPDYVLNHLTLMGSNRVLVNAMGDDNIWAIAGQISKEEWAEYVGKVFGLKIHPDKCMMKGELPYPEYLKRMWLPDGEKMNLLYLILNTVHPEWKRKYQGYSPWHIIYGLWYAYRNAFPYPSLTGEFLVKKMQDHGGIEALKSLPTHELPGIFRGFGYNALRQLYSSAKSIAEIIEWKSA